MQDGYGDICWTVLKGDEVSPRGKRTKELIGSTIMVLDVGRSLPLYTGRKCNAAIGAIEACQLVGGFSDPDLTCKIAPNMREFLEPEGHFHGAYGNRVRPQIEHVIRKLKSDRDSRQAVVNIWKWEWDLTESHPDLPCTVSLHFMIRNDRLLLHTHMRSNDVWWGLAYDAFQFTQLQLTVANLLEIEAGAYYHHTSSLHIYERDWDKVEDLHTPTKRMPVLFGFTDFDTAWKIGHNMAPDELTTTEEWYRDKLAPYF